MVMNVIDLSIKPVLTCPRLENLSGKTLSLIKSASDCLESFGELSFFKPSYLFLAEPFRSSKNLNEWDDELSGHWTDPLLEDFLAYHGGYYSKPHSLSHEYQVYSRSRFFIMDSSFFFKEGFLETTLLSVVSTLLGIRQSFREVDVFIDSDRHGVSVRYPPSELVKPHLEFIDRVVRDDALPTVYKAIVAYVTLIAAHPFLDSNGRVARILFNAILFSGTDNLAPYIPIRHLSALSQGAMSLHLRRVFHHGHWDACIAGLCASVLLTHRIASQTMLVGETPL